MHHAGIIAILIGERNIRKEKNIIKEKFFKRNGGHLLKQHVSAYKSPVKKIRIYSAKERRQQMAFVKTGSLAREDKVQCTKGYYCIDPLQLKKSQIS